MDRVGELQLHTRLPAFVVSNTAACHTKKSMRYLGLYYTTSTIKSSCMLIAEHTARQLICIRTVRAGARCWRGFRQQGCAGCACHADVRCDHVLKGICGRTGSNICLTRGSWKPSFANDVFSRPESFDTSCASRHGGGKDFQLGEQRHWQVLHLLILMASRGVSSRIWAIRWSSLLKLWPTAGQHPMTQPRQFRVSRGAHSV